MRGMHTHAGRRSRARILPGAHRRQRYTGVDRAGTVRYGSGMREVLQPLQSLIDSGQPAAVATVVNTRRSAPRPLGSRLIVSETGDMVGSVSGGCVESDVALQAAEVIASGEPRLLSYGISDDDAFDVGLPCGGEIEVFVAPADAEEVRRVSEALAAGDRLAVTTVLSGPQAGHKEYATGGAHSQAVRTDEATFVEHYARRRC